MSLRALRTRFVDAPGSLGGRSRARRWEALHTLFPALADMDVVDLGGTVRSWLRAPLMPRSVLVVNLVAEEPPPGGPVQCVQADACDLPSRVADASYDLVFSNSLIEHVGGHARRQQLAEAVHRLAPRHWIQAPYRYFPVEPHWLFPGFQFLPLHLRARIVQRWPLGHSRIGDFDHALAAAAGVELPSKTEFHLYFPDSALLLERLGPLTKSLVAVGGSETLGQEDRGRQRRLQEFTAA